MCCCVAATPVAVLQQQQQHFDIVARLLQFMRVINFTNGLQAGRRGKGGRGGGDARANEEEINLCNLEFAK